MVLLCLLLVLGNVLFTLHTGRLSRRCGLLEDQLARERDDHQNWLDHLPRDHPDTLARMRALEQELVQARHQLHSAQVVIAATVPLPDVERQAIEQAVNEVHARITQWQLRARVLHDGSRLSARRRALYGYTPGVNDPPLPDENVQPVQADNSGGGTGSPPEVHLPEGDHS